MLRFCEACNGYSFYFLSSVINILEVKSVFASYHMKLSLPMFLRCFFSFCLISASCFLHVTNMKLKLGMIYTCLY